MDDAAGAAVIKATARPDAHYSSTDAVLITMTRRTCNLTDKPDAERNI